MEHHGRTPNHLVDEKSPYLQQHAYNPVEWYPWGEEAFERARHEGKPIFLSIGYSTCHWCHVMERESFENEETAQLMNELFINIKVDREERPDVDQVYMTAAQAINGNGGWPLSAWLTPELQPYYVGTYFPPRPAHGRPSFRDALRSLHDAWHTQREKVDRSAKSIMRAIEKQSNVRDESGGEIDTTIIIEKCYSQLAASFDERYGGFGQAPKFPRPAIFEFLLRYAKERPETDDTANHALEMTHATLRRMSEGGMYDQLGGGFARYSVDSQWRVPHFEKMLYDQGQLLAVVADCYRMTGDPALERVMRHTVEYLERDLMHESGAFYSAEDADSEGEEGTFYVWTLAELGDLLEPNQFTAIRLYYGLTEAGNFEHGKNVLHTSSTLEAVAAEMESTPPEVEALLETARILLFDHRAKRPRPHRDEKILTSWNGLMISGLAKASAAVGDSHFAELAIRAVDFLIETMNISAPDSSTGSEATRLMHRLRDGDVKFPGYLEDYAFFIQGLIDLYEATFEERFLREADRLVGEANRLFWDMEGGGYYMTAGEDPSVLFRSKSDHDGAEPSGNSVMAMNLLRLGRIFYDEKLLELAERTLRMFSARIAGYPSMMPLMCAAAISHSHPPRQIVIAGSEDAEATRHLIQQVHSEYLPDTALLLVPHNRTGDWMSTRIESIHGMGPLEGRPALYICENYTCRQPVIEFQEG